MRPARFIAAACALPLLAAAPLQDAGGSFTLIDATSKQVHDAYWSKKPGPPQRAGNWETSFTITRIDLPDMPAGAERDAALARLKKAPQILSMCQSGQDLSAPEPRGMLESFGEDCRYPRISMGGGKMDALVQCSGPGGKPMTLAAKGSYDSARFALTLDIAMEAPAPTGKVALTMQIDGRHTAAACTK